MTPVPAAAASTALLDRLARIRERARARAEPAANPVRTSDRDDPEAARVRRDPAESARLRRARLSLAERRVLLSVIAQPMSAAHTRFGAPASN